MEVKNKKIGFVLTAAFENFSNVISEIKELVIKKAEIIPIMSYNSYNLDSKFGKSINFIKEIEEITGKQIIHTLEKSESIGRKNMTDIMIIAPCSRKYYF